MHYKSEQPGWKDVKQAVQIMLYKPKALPSFPTLHVKSEFYSIAEMGSQRQLLVIQFLYKGSNKKTLGECTDPSFHPYPNSLPDHQSILWSSCALHGLESVCYACFPLLHSFSSMWLLIFEYAYSVQQRIMLHLIIHNSHQFLSPSLKEACTLNDGKSVTCLS